MDLEVHSEEFKNLLTPREEPLPQPSFHEYV